MKSQPEIECLSRTKRDRMYSPDLKPQVEIDEPQVPILKSSPFDWMNNDVSF